MCFDFEFLLKPFYTQDYKIYSPMFSYNILEFYSYAFTFIAPGICSALATLPPTPTWCLPHHSPDTALDKLSNDVYVAESKRKKEIVVWPCFI